MPIASGPTKLLPFSHHFDYGYLAYRRPEFREIFEEMHVQLPLRRGDALFFNPALFHAAGDNDTAHHHRSANLLQISASWSKPMEHIDRQKILRHVWPTLQRLHSESVASSSKVEAAVQAIGDGYPFPTNLDRDPPPDTGVSGDSKSPEQTMTNCNDLFDVGSIVRHPNRTLLWKV